jgi:hypothetical protein
MKIVGGLISGALEISIRTRSGDKQIIQRETFVEIERLCGRDARSRAKRPVDESLSVAALSRIDGRVSAPDATCARA